MVRAAHTSTVWPRLLAAFGVAAALTLSAYMLISMTRFGGIIASIWFLLILPAFLSAMICYIGDPNRTQGPALYWSTPLVLIVLVDVGSAVFLHEGEVCLVMLSPIWLIGGWAGAFLMRRARKPRERIDPNIFKSSLICLPLLLGAVEHQLVFDPETFTVTRQVVIQAEPDAIWPYTLSNAHIADSEGRWTFAQSVIDLPRPRATVMHGQGVGAVRTAYWGKHISFEEHITAWAPNQALGWTFAFPNDSLQAYSDRHISPDGPFLKIDSGGYTLRRLGPDKTLLTLRTRYIARTHVNLYAAAWGEILLGGVEANILTVIKDRAEGRR